LFWSVNVLAVHNWCIGVFCRENVKDAMSTNAYIPSITGPLARAAALLNDKVKSSGFPAVSRLGLWSCIVSHLVERFVEGVSRVKKCPPQGRGLMAVDLEAVYTFANKHGPTLLQCLSRDRSYADQYIAAFYLESEGDVMQWIGKNKSMYPLRFMRALIMNGIGANMKKKQLKDLMTSVDGMYLLPPPPQQNTGGTSGMLAAVGNFSMAGLGNAGSSV
jgi:hypothetical protein